MLTIFNLNWILPDEIRRNEIYEGKLTKKKREDCWKKEKALAMDQNGVVAAQFLHTKEIVTRVARLEAALNKRDR